MCVPYLLLCDFINPPYLHGMERYSIHVCKRAGYLLDYYVPLGGLSKKCGACVYPCVKTYVYNAPYLGVFRLVFLCDPLPVEIHVPIRKGVASYYEYT
jgi:hypothetical protein